MPINISRRPLSSRQPLPYHRPLSAAGAFGLAFGLAAALLARPSQAYDYTFSPVSPTVSGTSYATYVTGVAADGDACGYYLDSSGNAHAALWLKGETGGAYSVLHQIGSLETDPTAGVGTAYDIASDANNKDYIVGTASSNYHAFQQAARWTWDGTTLTRTDIQGNISGDPANPYDGVSVAYGVNTNGDAVGYYMKVVYSSPTVNIGTLPDRVFLWPSGGGATEVTTVTTPGGNMGLIGYGVNTSGTVAGLLGAAGAIGTNQCAQGFYITSSHYGGTPASTNLLGSGYQDLDDDENGDPCVSYGISDDGYAVGQWQKNRDGLGHAYVWATSASTSSLLSEYTGDTYSLAHRVRSVTTVGSSSTSQVVGKSYTSSASRAVLWDLSSVTSGVPSYGGAVSLTAKFDTTQGTGHPYNGWTGLTDAQGVAVASGDHYGYIGGYGNDGTRTHGYVLVPND